MALTRTLDQMATRVRELCDIEGTSGIARHPTARIYENVNLGLAALKRLMDEVSPDQSSLSSTTISLTSGTSTYALPTDFKFCISVDLTAEGQKTWLLGYEMHERADLTDPSQSYRGIPWTDKLLGDNIEFLPTPTGSYSATLWYTGHSTELTDANNPFVTIERLDEYPVWYACRAVAKRDRLWDLHQILDADLAKLEAQVRLMVRARDMNSPPRMVDVCYADRFGRRRFWFNR